jgi:transcriptional regulator NrdR family protein
MKDLIVIKNDGDKEDFSDDKIVTSIAKSGMDIRESERIANDIKTHFENSSIDNEVKSSDIRKKVVEELLKVDSVASSSYDTYKS